MGPTACGKTSLSLSLAQALDAEIISVDSALVYEGMDVGTAKPSAEEQALIPHHLIDVRKIWQSYSAAEFCADANRLISQIHARGKRALLAGGTMLYFKALEEGLAELPEADEAVRAELKAQAERDGWISLHNELQTVDPVSAQRIHPNDPQRLQRALEVYRLTGKPLSELHSQKQSGLRVAPLKIAMIPTERAWLHQRIEQRFVSMIDSGFVDEVRHLRKDSRIHAELPAMRSVGYRQLWRYLDQQADSDKLNVSNSDEWVMQAIAATRQLAKRQLTWLRSMHNVTTLACDTLPAEQQQIAITTSLERHESLFR